MKGLILTSLSLAICIVVVTLAASISIPAQSNEERCLNPCDGLKRGRGDDAVRIPHAQSFKDEMGQTVYIINGNESWRRTGIEVRCGQKIEISAVGIVRWAPDGIEKIDVTPDGTRPPYRDGWNYRHFPFPEAGIGSLVMRIGKGVYPTGSSAAVEAEDAGFIEFMVNDDVLHDNSGFFHVKVNIKTPDQL